MSLNSSSVLPASCSSCNSSSQVFDNTGVSNTNTRSQEKTRAINSLVSSILAEGSEIKEDVIPKIDFNKVILSSELRDLIKKIRKEKVFTTNILIQTVIEFAIQRADLLSKILVENGIGGCDFTSAFHLLFIHTGIWYFELKSYDQQISELQPNKFYYLPKDFKGENLQAFCGTKVFNPLELNVKNHLYSCLIQAFMHSKGKARISWDEFCKQTSVVELMQDIIQASQGVKEIIDHKHFYALFEYMIECFVTDIAPSGYVQGNKSLQEIYERTERIFKGYSLYNKMLLLKCIGPARVGEAQTTNIPSASFHKDSGNEKGLNITRDMYWFNSPLYERCVQNCKNNPENPQNTIELLIGEFERLCGVLHQMRLEFNTAKKGLLTYKEWVKAKFDQTAPFDESKFIFKGRLKFQCDLLSLFANALGETLRDYFIKTPQIYGWNQSRDQCTRKVVRYYLGRPSLNSFEPKHHLIKSFSDEWKHVFEKINLNRICKQFLLSSTDINDWLDKIQHFSTFQKDMHRFNEYAPQLMLKKRELETHLMQASDKEREQMEREYDKLKSEYMLPIFILHSISLMYKDLKIIKPFTQENYEEFSNRPVQSVSFLDEIDSYFVDDAYFQLRCPEPLPKIEPEEIDEDDEQNEAELSITEASEEAVIPQPVEARPAKDVVVEIVSKDTPKAKNSSPKKSHKSKRQASVALPPQPPLSTTYTNTAVPPARIVSTPSSLSNEDKVSFPRGMKVRKLVKELADLGFDLNRQTGSHAIFKLNSQQVVVPTSRDTLPRGTLESIESRVNEIVQEKRTSS